MLLKDLKALDQLYKMYRFEILPVKNDYIRAYAYTSKYFSNADIILLNNVVSADILEKVIKEVSELGFAVTVRNYNSINEAEQSLFEGFFDIENSLKILTKSYSEYKKKVSDVIFNEYEYINSQFYDAETGKFRDDNLVDTIFNDFNIKGPVLTVLEAAAGFGKTSTSYEVVNKMVLQLNFNKIPLFAELSRNRQATIFKYVLYDEINRKFTGINLELVYKHITEGRIPVIIDGFDELLKPKDDLREERFEDAEPMLETIRELLHGEAKILLTTRRTAIFAGDEFHLWLEKNHDSFIFKRYSISTPTITDWITPAREKQLEKAGLNLKSISNPVLLAYLRNMDDQLFEQCINDIDKIIDDYIIKLMQREKDRQDLLMSEAEQKGVLKLISGYFVDHDVTSEVKEDIERLIFDKEQKLLFTVIERYPADRKPTIDQLTSKLTMHAFLDRKSDTSKQIGFVNDFIMGTFIGENLIDKRGSWFGTERFVDFLLTAYTPRSAASKKVIYELLKETVLDLLDSKRQIVIDNYLFGAINHELDSQFVEDIEFRNNFSSNCKISNTIFSSCFFYNITFDLSYLNDVFFIGCKFYNCQVDTDLAIANNISFNNCIAEPNFFKALMADKIEDGTAIDMEINTYEKSVLERFWPYGKDRFIPHRRIGTLRMGVPSENIPDIDIAIEDLTKRGIIIQRNGQHSVELNISKLNEIKQILGRP
jgi:hypothetical protein